MLQAQSKAYDAGAIAAFKKQALSSVSAKEKQVQEMVDMMGAELAIGHSYVRGGEMPEVPNDEGGLLGADLDRKSTR